MPGRRELSVILVFILNYYGARSNLAPTFSEDMDGLTLSENTPVGALVYQLKGTDPEGSKVTYGLNGTDRFFVDSSTGNVTLAEPLDREVNGSITFLVSIEDEVGDISNNVVTANVTVILLDENDNAPVFQNAPYIVSVSEDDPIGTTVLKDILVTDADIIGENLQLFCVHSLQSPEACRVFEINTQLQRQDKLNASLLLNAAVNYNTKKVYHFQLIANDGSFNTSTDVTVNVIDVQNLPPVFVSSLVHEVKEDAPIGTLILTVQAKDGDIGHPRFITYDLLTNPNDYFILDSITGELKIGKPLDRESLENPLLPLNLTVRAREINEDGRPLDGSLTTSIATIMITVQDVNDEAPKFNKMEYNVEIPENTPLGTLLPNLDMTVQDTDSGKNSAFALSLTDISGGFNVEPQEATGSTKVDLRLVNISLDYENPNQRKFIILVKAEELYTSPPLSSTARVIVSVKDVNDNRPMFKKAMFSSTISEQFTPGTHVITITATDKDHGRFGNEGIVYQLFGEGSELFNVDNRTGVVTVAFCITPGVSPCLDSEKQSQYIFNFMATDEDGLGQSTSVPLTILLYDANDNVPKFTNQNYVSYIDEGSMKFDPLLQVEAKDADKTSEIMYTILDGPQSDLFRIDRVTGKIELVGGKGINLTNMETSHITLNILASDGTYNATTTVNVIVRDVNNHAPVFTQEYYNTSVPEDAPIGTEVIQVLATDLDSGENAEVKYSIEKGSFENFSIDRDTGVIKVASKLDFDERNHYQIQINAVDQGTPSLTGSSIISIFIININDKPPYFTPKTQKVDVSSDAEIGDVIHQLTAVDPDIISQNDLKFDKSTRETITAGDKTAKQVTDISLIKQWFVIESDGKVRVGSKLNRSIAATVSIPVSVQDTSAPGIQIGYGYLFLTIVDVNISPPSFRQSHFVERMPEGLPKETILAAFHATDEDSSISHYVIDPPNNYFHIENSTGTVRSSQLIDYERVHQINFTIMAYDTGVPQLSSSALVTVNIVNVNDESPVFSESMYTTTLEENSPAGTLVLQVHAEDKDEGVFGEVRYSLSGDKANLFTIDGEMGDIRVATGADIDRELIEDVWLQVTAMDNAPLSDRRTSNASVHIKIIDQNDNSPIFIQKIYNTSVPENLSYSPPASILQVRAEDKDASLNGQIKYTLQEDTDFGYFIVDPNSGIIYPSQQLSGDTTHHLKVLATDRAGEGPHFDLALVYITVYAINKHPPVWVVPDISQNMLEIPESTAQPGLVLITLNATDKDPGENGRIAYYIRDGNKNVHETKEFFVNETSGELVTKILLDREIQSSYQLTLIASDHGSPQHKEAVKLLTVHLSDSNDNKPQFKEQEYRFNISENRPAGVIIGLVKAQDNDAGDNGKVFYHILEGNTNGAFFIDRTMGIIRSNRSFDREDVSEYTLTIVANNNPVYDEKENQVNMELSNEDDVSETDIDMSRATVHISILDENDNVPTFLQTTYYAGVESVSELNEFITSVVAVDPDNGDNGTISYTISKCDLYKLGNKDTEGNIFPRPFIIYPNGSLYTNTSMINYNQDRFVLNIVAQESQPPYNQTKADVYIWVVNMEQLIRLVFDRPCSVIKKMDTMSSLFYNAINTILVTKSIKRDLQHLNNDWCEVHVLMVNSETYQVIDVEPAVAMIDQLENLNSEHGIYSVDPALNSLEYPLSPEEKFDPAVAGLIALLIVLFAGIVAFVIIRTCLRQSSPMSSDIAIREKGSVRSRSRRLLAELSSTENPLWAEHKLRLYEEQELTMNVFGENNEGIQDLPNVDNTYATIQGGGDRDYATLNSPRNTSQCMSQDSGSTLEAMLGFQGSTFQPDIPVTPDPPPRSNHFQGQ